MPRPAITVEGRDRSHDDSRNMAAISAAAPAPKNAPACAPSTANPAAIAATARTANTIPMMRLRRARRASPAGSWPIVCAVSSARGDSFATARSESSTQTTAATIATESADGERQRRHVQRQLRRADRADPPRPQAVHDQLPVADRAGDADDAADRRQRDRLHQQQATDCRDREARGAQDADLPQPLLDAEAEEQDRQQQRGDDDEEAEVGEVQTEVGGADRCVGGEPAHRLHGDAERLGTNGRAGARARCRSATAVGGRAGGDDEAQ